MLEPYKHFFYIKNKNKKMDHASLMNPMQVMHMIKNYVILLADWNCISNLHSKQVVKYHVFTFDNSFGEIWYK